MQTSDEMANAEALTPEAAEPQMSQAEIQRLMQQYGLWNGRRAGKHATARAQAGKARVAKRKAKRKSR